MNTRRANSRRANWQICDRVPTNVSFLLASCHRKYACGFSHLSYSLQIPTGCVVLEITWCHRSHRFPTMLSSLLAPLWTGKISTWTSCVICSRRNCRIRTLLDQMEHKELLNRHSMKVNNIKISTYTQIHPSISHYSTRARHLIFGKILNWPEFINCLLFSCKLCNCSKKILIDYYPSASLPLNCLGSKRSFDKYVNRFITPASVSVLSAEYVRVEDLICETITDFRSLRYFKRSCNDSYLD